MTQKQAVIELFKSGIEVDTKICRQRTGCERLSARVYEMKEMGYVFTNGKVVHFSTRYGTRGHLKKYKLDLKKTPKRLLK
ncbi:MAG: helix-turn-helix domain-containing protein [Thiolinea sp.]